MRTSHPVSETAIATVLKRQAIFYWLPCIAVLVLVSFSCPQKIHNEFFGRGGRFCQHVSEKCSRGFSVQGVVSGVLSGLLHASGRSTCASFRRKCSAHFGESLHWRSRKHFREFPQILSKLSTTSQGAICSAWGWSLCAECAVVLICSVPIEWLHCLPT